MFSSLDDPRRVQFEEMRDEGDGMSTFDDDDLDDSNAAARAGVDDPVAAADSDFDDEDAKAEAEGNMSEPE